MKNLQEKLYNLKTLVFLGDLNEKDDLPVKQLRFGDTGTALDEREARYTLGPLICRGDDLFDNVVTFRIADATIDIPNFDMGHNGDIYFEFRYVVYHRYEFETKKNIFSGLPLKMPCCFTRKVPRTL